MDNSHLQNFVNHKYAAEISTGVIVTALFMGVGALCDTFDISVKGPFDLSENKILNQIMGGESKPNRPALRFDK